MYTSAAATSVTNGHQPDTRQEVRSDRDVQTQIGREFSHDGVSRLEKADAETESTTTSYLSMFRKLLGRRAYPDTNGFYMFLALMNRWLAARKKLHEESRYWDDKFIASLNADCEALERKCLENIDRQLRYSIGYHERAHYS